MNVPGLCGPSDTVGGIVYFARMLAKVRLHAQGKLPKECQENLGVGFDGRCCTFLQVRYEDVATRVKLGGSDEDVLQWCFENGRKPSEEEIEIWNGFMSKRGWRDEVSDRLVHRKKESGFETRADIQTMFDYIDADEGRKPGRR